MWASIPDARPAAAAEENRFLGIQHSLASTRHTIRPHWQADTRRLLRKNETGAYHHAQRLAARARDGGRSRELAYWAKVARGSAARKGSRDHAGHRRRGDPAGRQDIAASRRAAVQQGPSAGNAATGSLSRQFVRERRRPMEAAQFRSSGMSPGPVPDLPRSTRCGVGYAKRAATASATSW